MGVNKTIGYVNEKIGHVNETIQSEELKTINVTITCNKEADKHKKTSSAYDSKGKEKTSRTSENKEKARDDYVLMYEYGKHL